MAVESEKSIHPQPESPPLVVLGLGSNLGDRDAYLRAALQALAPTYQVERISRVYETAPQLVAEQPPYHNLVCAGRTAHGPHALLRFLKTLEQRLGRQPSYRYGPREIDLDILLYGDQIIATPDLIIPHPRMTERAFVLVPLAEILPDLRHPLLQQSISALAAGVCDQPVKPLAPLVFF
jgi:2-amino-4-hydroxy-6-hydroxymethyldihydropteridine diphosphokinase